MSSTRYRQDGSAVSQEAYASSSAHEVGLLGNLVARRCKVAMRSEHRALCYFLQQLSHRDGGLRRVADEILAAFPEKFRTPGMRGLALKPGQKLDDDEREALRHDFPDTPNRSAQDDAALLDGFFCPRDDDFPTQADDLFAICRKAAAGGGLESALRALCLDPRTNLEKPSFYYQLPGRRENCLDSTWWIEDFVGTLMLFRQRQIDAARDAIADTQVSRMVHKAIGIATFAKGLAVVEGDQRTGKSTAARNYCDMHPGEAVFIDLESGGDETSFFRSLARSIGTASSGQLKALELRGKIEDMLQAGHLTVVFDEAHWLIPISARPKCPPKRLDWVRRSLLDKGVPVVFVSTPQFDRQCTHYEKHLQWNAKQLRGRITWKELLPATLTEEEVMAVARKIAPAADAPSVVRLAAYALDAQEYLFGIKRVVDIASFFAHQEGRTVATRADIKRALDQVAPERAGTGKAAKQADGKQSCKETAKPVQTAEQDFSDDAPAHLARRAGMNSQTAQTAGFGANGRLQFTEVAASD